jgi:hypothetical protein
MTKKRFLAGALTAALVLALAVTACGGKAKAQSSSGGDPVAGLEQAAAGAVAADLKQAAGAVKELAGAVKGGGQPAAATDFIYELNKAEDGVVITNIHEDSKFGAHLVVPAEIEGYPVVAFLARYNDDVAKSRKRPPLESVVFPDSIIYLGASDIWVYKDSTDNSGHQPEDDYKELAQFGDYGRRSYSAGFSGSESLKSIVFPKNLKVIPSGFAPGCPGLPEKGITWPEALEVIGEEAFARDSFTELVIPEGVRIIGSGAFSENKTLKSVTIPDSIEVIEAVTFRGCPELSAVNIPAHPIKYSRDNRPPNSSFDDCPKLRLAAQIAISDTGYPDF